MNQTNKSILTQIKPIFAIAALLAFATTSFSQGNNGSAGSVGISFQTLPNRDFKDTTGKFGYNNLGINLTVPLFGNKNKIMDGLATGDISSLHFYRTSLHANFESLPNTIGFITNVSPFYTGSAGLGLLYGSKKNIFIANANIGMAADEQVIKNNDIRYRFSGAFIVNNRHSATTTYIYGIAFSYTYGRALPLPVLGIRKKFSADSKWSISGILPLSVKVTDKMNKNSSLSFYLKPNGNKFQIANQGNFATTSSFASMQLRQFQLGVGYNYKMGEHFNLSADAGLLFGGKLKFTEYNDRKVVLSEAAIKPGPSIKIGLRYRFSKKRDKMEDEDGIGGLL